VKRALDSQENYNLLFVGAPASAKTLFLQGILDFKKGVYFDGSNTTSRILDVLEEERPKVICIDELLIGISLEMTLQHRSNIGPLMRI
jgi:hypothetical protein